VTPVPLFADWKNDFVAAVSRCHVGVAADFQPARREFGFPLVNRLVAENDAADQEHLRQIAQGKLIAQPPEHHEGDDLAGILRLVQNAGPPLVELLAAAATAEPAVTLGGALTSF
jgi:hypothetical protein